MIVYKGQGINWHPQTDSLGVSPLKRTRSTHPFISSSRSLVESLRQLTCFIGCFTQTLHCSSPTNWWSDGTDKLWSPAIPPHLYRKKAEWVGRLDRPCTILLQYKETVFHKEIPLWSYPHLFPTDGNRKEKYWGIRIASSNQVQRQQQRDEPVRENTHLVLDTLASRLRSYHLIIGVESFFLFRS